MLHQYASTIRYPKRKPAATARLAPLPTETQNTLSRTVLDHGPALTVLGCFKMCPSLGCTRVLLPRGTPRERKWGAPLQFYLYILSRASLFFTN
jgi:hypothetical protein